MKFLLGKKVNMTTVFDDMGNAHAGTIVAVEPLTILGQRTKDTDGYDAVRVGYGTRRETLVSKPEKGTYGGFGVFQGIKEFRDPKGLPNEFKVGEVIPVMFAQGDSVIVSAVSKGKGFQGVVKRHGFGGGRRSHGQKHSEREPGAIGGGGRAGGRVTKGMRMAGRMGGDRITMKGAKILVVNTDTKEIIISGGIPGRRGTLIEVRG